VISDPEGHELSHVLARVPPVDRCRVLEIGCGDGRLTRRYARHVDSVLACDPDERATSAFRTIGIDTNVELRSVPVDRIEVPAQSLDVVLFSWAL
jgi:16S rRNA A1518/A1519 N6-dimethyltransferase RsmA/KsgA/DIM1 with predicted DNA glycosylase/AP lyase activity